MAAAQHNPPPPIAPRPPPESSFPLEHLPHPAHEVIAACLPDGDRFSTCLLGGYGPMIRLRMSAVSRTILDLYGGTLLALAVRTGECTEPNLPTHQVEALARLEQRSTRLE